MNEIKSKSFQSFEDLFGEMDDEQFRCIALVFVNATGTMRIIGATGEPQLDARIIRSVQTAMVDAVCPKN